MLLLLLRAQALSLQDTVMPALWDAACAADVWTPHELVGIPIFL